MAADENAAASELDGVRKMGEKLYALRSAS